MCHKDRDFAFYLARKLRIAESALREIRDDVGKCVVVADEGTHYKRCSVIAGNALRALEHMTEGE